jgi:hypothetical protein
VYSLGATAFEALAGRLPRPAGSMVDVVDARRSPAVALSSLVPDLRAFDRPIAAGLALDPAGRPTPAQFASSLVMAQAEWQASAARRKRDPVPPQPATNLRPGSRRAERRRSEASTEVVRVAGPGVGGVRRRSIVGLAAALGAGAVIGLVALMASLAGSGASPTTRPSGTPPVSLVPSGTPSSSVGPTEVPSASPSLSPPPFGTEIPSASAEITPPPVTPVPSPTRRPTLPPFYDPVQVRQDLQNVRTAIGNAVALGVLQGSDAALLHELTDAIDRALDADDRAAAGTAAAKLLSTVDQFINDGRLRSGGELRHWAQVVSQLLPEPP